MDLDPFVPMLFSFLHDSQRFDEGSDVEHGPRAVDWIQKLHKNSELKISATDLYFLCEAVNGHSDGQTEAHPIVQICWDSDRLDLGRVGIMPNPLYLCTRHAKHPDTIRRAWFRSIGEPQNQST